MVIYQIFETTDIKGYKALRGNDLLSVSPWAFLTAFLWNIISCNLSQWHNTPPQTCNGQYFINPLSAVSPCTIVASSSQWVYIRKFSICTYSFLQHLVGKLPLRKAAERLSWAFYCDSFNKVDSSLDGWWFYSNKQERNQTFHSNQSVMHEWWE